MLRTLTFAVALVLVPLVQAHDDEMLFNRVSLQAEAQREIPNDEMRVLLVAEHQGNEPAKLSEQVNRDIGWALERAGRIDAIDAETQGYVTQPIYNNGAISGWSVRQELQLKTSEFAKLTEVLGTLQQRLQIRQMGFSPTSATRKQHQNELITEAIRSFKERIAIIQQNMDDKDYRIIEMNVNTDGSGPRPMRAEMSMAKMESSRPAVEAGTSEITVTVSGSVQFY